MLGASTVTQVNIEGRQSLDCAVTGNGGSAVQYGKYLYFINGTRGYEDTDGTNNVAGQVIKALFTAPSLPAKTVANAGVTGAMGG